MRASAKPRLKRGGFSCDFRLLRFVCLFVGFVRGCSVSLIVTYYLLIKVACLFLLGELLLLVKNLPLFIRKYIPQKNQLIFIWHHKY